MKQAHSPTETEQQQQTIVAGRIGRTHGIKGWVKIISFTEPLEQILQYQPWQLIHKSSSQLLNIKHGHRHGKGLIAKLPGIDTPEQAAVYTNVDIIIDKIQLPDLEEGEFYWSDLQGLDVFDQQNEKLGVVDHLIATGANDVLVIHGGDKELLIPYLPDRVVKNIDLIKQRMIVDWDKDF
ncbi:MAG: ribosome maturation factor RimM [Gammaproteobacteria bacterium]|nr:ribosome maturation factor RimM [Gammaproteobacteria bacterium]